MFVGGEPRATQDERGATGPPQRSEAPSRDHRARPARPVRDAGAGQAFLHFGQSGLQHLRFEKTGLYFGVMMCRVRLRYA